MNPLILKPYNPCLTCTLDSDALDRLEPWSPDSSRTRALNPNPWNQTPRTLFATGLKSNPEPFFNEVSLKCFQQYPKFTP